LIIILTPLCSAQKINCHITAELHTPSFEDDFLLVFSIRFWEILLLSNARDINARDKKAREINARDVKDGGNCGKI
jgi:hypothetical protein